MERLSLLNGRSMDSYQFHSICTGNHATPHHFTFDAATN
jgi:hypothetical protein